jgi:hypothetical protein
MNNQTDEQGEMKILKPTTKRFSVTGMDVNNLSFTIRPKDTNSNVTYY